jgi:hypothetical protein
LVFISQSWVMKFYILAQLFLCASFSGESFYNRKMLQSTLCM